MTNWSPFEEARENLDNYDFFLKTQELRKEISGQDLEDLLDDICPKSWCYVWVYPNLYERKIHIVDWLIGVPEEVSLAPKLGTGAEVFRSDNYCIRTNLSGTFRMERKCPA